FQAEDGIRDFHVTGVQTCALPISQTEIITEKLKKFHDIVETDITIGTAHRFQGDEKDIILFSPAVSEGVKPGTLHWIQTTNQLRSEERRVGKEGSTRCSPEQ